MLRTKPEFLNADELGRIHEGTLHLLREVGVAIPSEEARDVFERHGAKVEGQRVHVDEALLNQALESAPSQFIVHARDPRRDVSIGGENQVFAPGYGPPFVMELDGTTRPGTMKDYDNLTRLADALPNIDMSGHMVVEPSDVDSAGAYLYMLRSSMVNSSKPFMGSAQGAEGARASVEMAGILFGGQESLRERPVMISLINSLSPLSYSMEMIEALMEHARWRQPIVIAALVQAGASGPVTIAGTLALQNAEILTGIALAQLVSPGTPVVYGATSTSIDMSTGGLALGAPELAIFIACTAQMASYYGLPSRSGGCLTDAHLLDVQAGMESMMAMLTTAQSGVHVVIHAAGILSSYLAISYEKMVMDDEICGMVHRFRQGFGATADDLALDVIAGVGPGGTFLMEDHTLERCRTEFFLPKVANRKGRGDWEAKGRKSADEVARDRWQKLLDCHEAPQPDSSLVADLDRYIETKLC